MAVSTHTFVIITAAIVMVGHIKEGGSMIGSLTQTSRWTHIR
jgi:hypothetical protein